MAAREEDFVFAVQRSWGVASARHTSGIVVRNADSPYLFDAPLGPSVVRWDLKKNERVKQFQVRTRDYQCCTVSSTSIT